MVNYLELQKMSKLISAKEAKMAWANGEDVQIDTGAGFKNLNGVYYLAVFDEDRDNKFRIKPRIITINGAELPAPYEPKDNDICYVLTDSYECGYMQTAWQFNKHSRPAWRTEKEIRSVVAKLREVFGETR